MNRGQLHETPPVAVITGATRGLGRGIAVALAKRGYAVVIAAQGEVQAAAASLAEAGLAVTGLPCDVRDPLSVEALAGGVLDRFGRIDCWVNNAGLALTAQTLVGHDPGDLRRMVDVNILGVMHGCRAAISAMSTRGGAIYNMHGAGSDGVPVPGMIGYATTKRAVQFLTTALAAELAGSGILVGGISPGLVMTEGFFREHARVPAGLRAEREKVVNLIGDSVETVSAWAARIIATNRMSGREFRWLTPAKIRKRALASRPRDLLAAYRDGQGQLPQVLDV